MSFRTPIQLNKFGKQISHDSPVLMLGSCFTDNVGEQMKNYLFHVTVNPFGVIYNPLSVKRALEALMHKDHYTAEDLEHHNELWFSFDHYTKYSDPDQVRTLQKINQDFIAAKKSLRAAGFLIITFGTAYTYRNKASGEIVNNCHKIPAAEFERYMLSPKSIIQEYSQLIPELLHINQELQLIFTVSPVRHLKDGLEENQRSKAALLLAIHELAEAFPDSMHYFPAYEIMMDDLRDYRFYEADLVHPNKQAIKYIWERFLETAVTREAHSIIQEIEPLLRDKRHRPLHTETEAFKRFMGQLTKKEQGLKNKYPFLNWSAWA